MENITNQVKVNVEQHALFVLVHGAWAAPFAWKQVQDILTESGYQSIALQLPGHGSDNADPKTLHMDSYISYVTDAIKQTGKKVILVGHSMAGMIVSGVAEQIPQLIEKLIFVAAYLPQSGQSAFAISSIDTQSLLGASLIVSEDHSTFDVKLENALNIFCQDAPAYIQQLVLANYKPEPAAPFSDTVNLTEANFGKVKKFYIETLQDHGIGNILQKQMIAASDIIDSYDLDSGHCPMLSQPQQLSEILIEIASENI